jgi:HNH endonuclease
VYGAFPVGSLDHVNGIKTDNRISNLREATHAENQRNQGMYCNNKTGYKGVHWANRERKYIAQCSVNGREHNLGSFDTAEAAYQAYREFASRQHGEFFHE